MAGVPLSFPLQNRWQWMVLELRSFQDSARRSCILMLADGEDVEHATFLSRPLRYIKDWKYSDHAKSQCNPENYRVVGEKSLTRA